MSRNRRTSSRMDPDNMFNQMLFGQRRRSSNSRMHDPSMSRQRSSSSRMHHPSMSKHRSSSSRMHHRPSMPSCQQLANIIGGQVITTSPACVVQRLRNINASILGRRTRSPLALPFALSFENNIKGQTLNLGETVILQSEINRFLTALRRRGITVTALHNHWLFDKPRLMYVHWENVGDPTRFATNSYQAAQEAGLF